MHTTQEWQIDALNARHGRDPSWWEGCLIRIADGDTIYDICEGEYKKSSMRHWIRADDTRETAYLDAIDRRREGWIEQLQARTARAAFSTIQDALTGDGGALEISQWSPGLVSACDTAEFGPNGQIYKVKMDAGKAADRLARYVGLDKAGEVNVSVYSLVGVLSEMPRAVARELPGAPKQIEAEDAVLVETEADAGEAVEAVTLAGTPSPSNPPRQSAPEPNYGPI